MEAPENKVPASIQLEAYVLALKVLSDAYYAANMPSLQGPDFIIKFGEKYAKIIKRDVASGADGGSVHTFVNLENGDILKAASYKAPAKNGVRGNIFNPNCDVGVKVSQYGAIYLR